MPRGRQIALCVPHVERVEPAGREQATAAFLILPLPRGSF